MDDRVVKTAVVVGGGPVGCLAAISLARRGWKVDVYEARPDLRDAASIQNTKLRSINLAISHRGLAAIQVIDPLAAQRFLETVIPMKGRMIHDPNCTLSSQLYDKDGQCINSIDRALLNRSLLDQASSSPNIRLFFNHKIQLVDFDKKTMTVLNLDSGTVFSVEFDLCVGADGSYSVIRRQMMKVVRMDFQQEYIRDEYVEFKMPPGRGDRGQPVFLLDPDHLHIWPRHSFMFIALPNQDKSFTCTLFAPASLLDTLGDRATFLSWFRQHFRDAFELIGENSLATAWELNPRSPLICTKSNPYHYLDRAILLGDAAHSMVPFYGQGLNCGLEDVRVLDTLLTESEVQATAPANFDRGSIDTRLAAALAEYSESRHDDLVAICELAMANYLEMRHSVTTPVYLFRKGLDRLLYSLTSQGTKSVSSLVPLLTGTRFSMAVAGWIPLYTMVTFRPDISYGAAKRRGERQSFVLSILGWVGTGVAVAGVVSISRGLRGGISLWK
ncbi:Kynurenine 3-monooxygenase [Mycena indigotica]|uniref:Kynurenine 3-monooxygenase n=1 Tax=Mycena indigotica TaxID=2126181 RepID=A0A8H6S9U1_9AGAR|nr:Kynurenine 3-monooxygenase [Mycena indigotica]KAF7295012.1 Kynurenine 3-monooxygenase [Mycena indigotica]